MLPIPALASPDVLRTMAHELRQPLSTIESIAYYLTLVVPKDDEKIQEQLDRIQHLVEQSNWIVTSAQQLSEPIQICSKPVHLDRLLQEIIAERSIAGEAPALEFQDELPPANADPALARYMLDNLLCLFRVIARPGFFVKVAACGVGVAVEMSTGASGYKSEMSLGPGATLSLESARRIAAAHGGSLDLKIDPESGVRLRVVLP